MSNNYELPPYLTIFDLMVLFVVAESTIRRWTREARAGRSRFPLPLDMGRNGGKGRSKLLWSRESILAFQNGSQSEASQRSEPPVEVPGVESAAEREQRCKAAMRALQSLGVKINCDQ